MQKEWLNTVGLFTVLLPTVIHFDTFQSQDGSKNVKIGI